MENLKIKIKDTEVSISLGWFLFIIAVFVFGALILFDVLSLSGAYTEAIRIWRDIKK